MYVVFLLLVTFNIKFQDNSSGIQVSTWCSSTIPAVVLRVDVNVYWPWSLAFCTDETAGRFHNDGDLWRLKLCHLCTSYLEQSTC